jgi:hypothetical protein
MLIIRPLDKGKLKILSLGKIFFVLINIWQALKTINI